jgi:hypothetical protein
MSDTTQDPGGTQEEGGYGYPTLEQEVTPEVLAAAGDGAAPADDDGPTPGELEEDPVAVEPTD